MMDFTTADWCIIGAGCVFAALGMAALFGEPVESPMVLHKRLRLGVDDFAVTSQSEDGEHIELFGPDTTILEPGDIVHMDQMDAVTTNWTVSYVTHGKKVRCVRIES